MMSKANITNTQRQQFTGCKTNDDVKVGYIGETKNNLREGIKSLFFRRNTDKILIWR